MKRYPAYDPPEYVDWSPAPEVMEDFRAKIGSDSARREILGTLTPDRHLRLYKGLVRNRLHDVALKRWVRQGVISKAWLGTGEEAATIGVVHALKRGDVVGPMIRNAGACHEMGMTLADMLRGYLGTADSPSRGRDVHIGDLEKGVLAPISMLTSSVPVCAGMALAFKVRREPRLALTWVGDGSTRTTGFHEGMMCARSFRVPFIAAVQDNGIALGTLVAMHSRRPMEEVATIYNTPLVVCDGNHVLDVYAGTVLAAEMCRAGQGPVSLVLKTFRMGGHATHDEGESRAILPKELFHEWGRRDPIGMYETYLAEADFSLQPDNQVRDGGDAKSNREILEQAEAEVLAEIDRAEQEALASREANLPRPETQGLGVLAG